VRIVVSGRLAAVPAQGGATWAVLQYVLGLRRLRHDVWFVEPVERVDQHQVRYFRDVVGTFDLEDRAVLYEEGGAAAAGTALDRLLDALGTADLLVNISGVLRDPELLERPARRLYLDVDPAFTQLWHLQGVDVGIDGHERYATVGGLIGSASCTVPTCGLDWIPTDQPVVLDEWPAVEELRHDALTTVGHWRGYGSIEHAGTIYGQRAHSMRTLVELPGLVDTPLMPALAIHPGETDDLESLDRNGWQVLDPEAVAGTPHSYRAFVQGSLGEIGIPKAGYVTSRCGWFSDRSVCYLASGRPVVVQDTGFSELVPTGDGLLAFDTTGQAAAAVDDLRSRYPRHARAARELAVAYFDSDRVLSRLLEDVTR
jgi:hypothetical protein